MSIYTKNGDGGLSSTMNRMRIEKNSPIFALLGTLDEFTSALGMAKGKLPPDLAEIVQQVQSDVISLCGELAGGERFASAEKTAGLEKAIDSMMEAVKPFAGFIVPGGTEGGAALDLARAVVRRAEREAVALSQRSGMSRHVLGWLNRVSDMVYALARMADQLGGTPGKAVSAAAPLPAQGDGGSFLELAGKLCRGVIEAAREQGLRVVAAACDGGGNLVCLNRDDGAYIASVDIAWNKAYTSVSLKMPTEEVGRLAQPGAPLYGIQNTNQGRIVLFGGGVPLQAGGTMIGGLGVSGGSAEQDTELARRGLELYRRLAGSV